MNMTTAPLIGQPVDRAEDRRFLTGTGTFVDDLKREGCCTRWSCAAAWRMDRINGVDSVGCAERGRACGA
jgi:CO/xanthine dehydrogenase Mo-binding subunit